MFRSMVAEPDHRHRIDRRAGSSRTWGRTATRWRMAETSALVILGKNAPSVGGGNDWTYSHRWLQRRTAVCLRVGWGVRPGAGTRAGGCSSWSLARRQQRVVRDRGGKIVPLMAG